MNWLDLLKADQLEILEQSEAEAQRYWDYHIGLAIGIDKAFKDNVKRDTNISRSGLVDEFKVYTWVDTETKLPLISRTVGFGHDRFEGKQVVYFAGSTGLAYQLKKWKISPSPTDKCWTKEEGWEKCDVEEEEIQGQPRQGESKEEAKKRGDWFKRYIRGYFRGKTAEDVFEDKGTGKPYEGMDESRLETSRQIGYYVNPNRMDLFTIADKHAGWDLKGSSTDSLNRVSPLYRRTQNYLLDKYKGNWIITVLINLQLREYYQTSKGGNFRQANFFTRSRGRNLVPPNIRELIRKVLGMRSAPWYIHTPTEIDTSIQGQDFGTDFLRAADRQPVDEDDNTPGPNFRLMPTIRETGSLRENEVVNIKDEEHCCRVMKNRIKKWLDDNYVSPEYDWQPNSGIMDRRRSWSETLLRIPHLLIQKLDELDLIVNIQDGMDCIVLRDLVENIDFTIDTIYDVGNDVLDDTDEEHADFENPNYAGRERAARRRRERTTIKREFTHSKSICKEWIEKVLEEWDECAKANQDKFEHWDSDFTASTKIDSWFGLVKEGDAVTFGGHGEGKQEALFAPEFSNDCGCGMEECECQKKR